MVPDYLSITVKDTISIFTRMETATPAVPEDRLSSLTEVVPFLPDGQFLVLSENKRDK